MRRPISTIRAIQLLAVHELRLTARRAENVLVTLVVPPAVLAFFATAGVVPGIAGPAVDHLLPGILALAIIASGLVNLGIATAFDRQYGVLKRLGGSPVMRAEVIAARIVVVLVLELLQAVVLVTVAVAFLGWRAPAGLSVPLALGAGALGTLAFAGLGLLIAGTLRAEAVLALANGLFLGLLMLGGIVLPLDHLAPPLGALGGLLPASALTESFRVALTGSGDLGGPLALLAVWGLGATGLAARTFRWD